MSQGIRWRTLPEVCNIPSTKLVHAFITLLCPFPRFFRLGFFSIPLPTEPLHILGRPGEFLSDFIDLHKDGFFLFFKDLHVIDLGVENVFRLLRRDPLCSGELES